MLIAINTCYGGFCLSEKAQSRLNCHKNAKYDFHNDYENRTCESLINTINELGAVANGLCAELKVVEIPNDVEFVIDDYDGIESIHEKSRVWR